MKPCHNQRLSTRSPSRPNRMPVQAAPVSRSTLSARPASQTPVHRYIHPIRTARPVQRSGVEELLADVLEALSRQSVQLDEVLRRLEGDNSDTI